MQNNKQSQLDKNTANSICAIIPFKITTSKITKTV